MGPQIQLYIIIGSVGLFIGALILWLLNFPNFRETFDTSDSDS
jgi:hypothetical protein